MKPARISVKFLLTRNFLKRGFYEEKELMDLVWDQMRRAVWEGHIVDALFDREKDGRILKASAILQSWNSCAIIKTDYSSSRVTHKVVSRSSLEAIDFNFGVNFPELKSIELEALCRK